MNKKTMAALLIAFTVAVPVLGNSAVVSAAEVTESVQAVKTGAEKQQAKKIIEVAKGELGYKEGKNGYTKFGDWYGKGFANSPWCAMFVSWCANKAGIPTSVIPKFASCSAGAEWFQKHNAWKGKNYTPKKGDLIFFTYSHVGIVDYVKDGTIHTIEGNTTGDMVKRRTHQLKADNIKGFGVPKYTK